MIISLVQNVALLLAMAFLYDLAVSSRATRLAGADRRDGGRWLLRGGLTGLVLGIIGIAVMASSWELREGVILDTRSVLLAAVGLFFGLLPSVVAVLVTALYRIYLGGAGMTTGVVVIVATASVGLGSRVWLRDRLSRLRWSELAVVGLVAHVVMLSVFLLVPFEDSWTVVHEILAPVLVIYPLAFVAVGMLLSRRRRAAELMDRVAESEANYRSVFENEHLATVVIEPMTGRIVDVNRRACEFYGYSRDQMLEMTTSDLEVLPREEVIGQIDEGRAAGKTAFEFQHRLASGAIRDVEVIGGAVTIGGEMRVHTVINDVTDRKRAEAEVVAAQDQMHRVQRIEALGRLAGGMAHDINNMLQVITGYTDLLQAEASAGTETAENLAEIRSAAERSSDLVQQLLAFARRQPASPRVIRADQVIDDAVRMLRRVVGADVEVVWRSIGNPWNVRLDPGQLEQVLTNLALNARAAMPTGGRLEIEARNVTLGAPGPTDPPEARAGEYVFITVADTGTGIEPDDLPFVFEPFFTTRSESDGTGLGLAIVYGILSQHGGFATVTSEPGVGSEFRLYVPRCHDPVDGRGAGDDEATLSMGSVTATVLLVDDEPGVRRMADRILTRAGCRVLAASSGDDAIEVARAHAGPIDLVVTDVVMPGLGVQKMVDLLRTERPGIPVVYMSGFAGDAITERGLAPEGIDLLGKPFGGSELIERVTAALSRP